jgi:CRP/FNR family transcriptional regulator
MLYLGLPEVLELIGARGTAGADTGERFATHRMARGQSLVLEGAKADAIYLVQSGSFKTVRTAEDGYEYVLGFAWRGDVIGYDGIASSHYAFSSIALEDSHVLRLPIGQVDALRRRVPAFDTALQVLLSRQLAHAGEIAEVMSAVAADVRLARFLVQLSARMAERGQSPRRLLLRMNRRDIANHLGLAHETISRAFRQLAERGWLRVENRDIEILGSEGLAGLKRFARCTRRMVEDDDTLTAAELAAA